MVALALKIWASPLHNKFGAKLFANQELVVLSALANFSLLRSLQDPEVLEIHDVTYTIA